MTPAPASNSAEVRQEGDLSRVGVVIISYYSDDLVMAQLAAIPAEVPVVVADNAGRNSLERKIAEARPDAVWLHFPENIGFGAAANRGAAKLDTEYLLILNPDTPIDLNVWRACLHEMDAAPKIGAMGEIRPMRLGTVLFGIPLKVSTYLTGAFLFLRASAFRRIKGFDEDYFLYFEDADLSMRMRRAGFSLKHAPGIVKHSDGNSVEEARDNPLERDWLFGAGLEIFRQKNRSNIAGLYCRYIALRARQKRNQSKTCDGWIRGVDAVRARGFGAVSESPLVGNRNQTQV